MSQFGAPGRSWRVTCVSVSVSWSLSVDSCGWQVGSQTLWFCPHWGPGAPVPVILATLARAAPTEQFMALSPMPSLLGLHLLCCCVRLCLHQCEQRSCLPAPTCPHPRAARNPSSAVNCGRYWARVTSRAQLAYALGGPCVTIARRLSALSKLGNCGLGLALWASLGGARTCSEPEFFWVSVNPAPQQPCLALMLPPGYST